MHELAARPGRALDFDSAECALEKVAVRGSAVHAQMHRHRMETVRDRTGCSCHSRQDINSSDSVPCSHVEWLSPNVGDNTPKWITSSPGDNYATRRCRVTVRPAAVHLPHDPPDRASV